MFTSRDPTQHVLMSSTTAFNLCITKKQRRGERNMREEERRKRRMWTLRRKWMCLLRRLKRGRRSRKECKKEDDDHHHSSEHTGMTMRGDDERGWERERRGGGQTKRGSCLDSRAREDETLREAKEHESEGKGNDSHQTQRWVHWLRDQSVAPVVVCSDHSSDELRLKRTEEKDD